jgi:hypothetical protein
MVCWREGVKTHIRAMTTRPRRLQIPDHIKALLKRNAQPQAMWYVGTLHAENGRDVRVKSMGKMSKEFEKPLEVRRSGADPDQALREHAGS